MSTSAERPASPPLRIEGPEDLQRAMRTTFAPSEQQWAAISAPLAPSVVIAGAGSGKTTLMAARVVYLVLTGQVRPEQVLGLTFTTKAAAELRARIRSALTAAGVLPAAAGAGAGAGVSGVGVSDIGDPDGGEEPLEPTVATYHAYAAALLTEHGLRIGHEPDTRVITDASRYQLGARAVERHAGPVEALSDHPPTVIQQLLTLDAAMSEHLVGPEEVRAADQAALQSFRRALAEEEAGKARKTHREAMAKGVAAIDRRGELLDLVAGYRRLKAELGLMDFSDQIALAARLAAEQPEVGAIEREHYRVVLLDEYQDTSVAQARLLSRLFSGPDAAHGRGHPVTAVGDPNQAIYGWRGASASNIIRFPETFPALDGEVPVLPLSVNRRSDRRILTVANALAEPLYAVLPQVRPLQAKEDAEDGEVSTRVFATQAEELDWLGAAVEEAHTGAWSDIGVLARDNTTAAACFDALTARGIPVEIVGLSGLLRLPEVAEVVAVLSLLHDVTDNTALLTLLTGPRWAVGPRDLALLGRRAEELAGMRRAGAAALGGTDQLWAIVEGVDPAELPALSDALEDPGDAGYAPEALERFGLLAAELRMLRAGAAEPILDVVRRIVDVTGVDIELASAVSPAAAARRDNLDLFLKAVAEFQSIDGDVTLPALLAYLTAEDDQGNGLDLATPSEADSVKLLTVHRAKGLEWDTVFLVGMCETRFPSNRSRTLWTTSPAVLPASLRGDAGDLPQLAGFDKPALDRYRADTRAHDATEELRLGYVAFTRAARRLHVSSYCWGSRATPYGPSAFQRTLRETVTGWNGEVHWMDAPAKGEPNPLLEQEGGAPWPVPGLGREARLRRDAAALVAAAGGAPATEEAATEDTATEEAEEELDVLEAARVETWDRELDRLLAEARAERGGALEVPLPSSLSATALGRLGEDAQAFARELARPMPRPPSPAARFGTRFHAWIEARFGQQGLIEPDELPGRADAGIADDDELAAVIAAFEVGPFADRVPVAVEPAFALVLAGQVIRGRIDAVYAETAPDGAPGYLVVDWKTNRAQTADPVQLAVYRVAWAELVGVAPERVRVAFHYVRTGETIEPADLPGRVELGRLLAG